MTRLGPYEIGSQIGSGGMGEVYRARDTRLSRDVAIKTLPSTLSADGDRLRRFTQEARAAAALNHPNICAVYDVGGGESNEPPFIAMELLEGETLQQRVTRGPLDIARVIEDGIALADALDAAHGKGIIHRDIKPGNIFLTPHGPKILDFGLAKALPSQLGVSAEPTAAADSPLTSAGTAVGTVAYMSPEQLRGEPLDGRSDVFSLGLVLYEMVTGRAAFMGATTPAVAAAILHEAPRPPRELRPDAPARLDDIILEALEKDRDVRYQSASAIRAALKRLKRDLGAAAPRLSDATIPFSHSTRVVGVGETGAPSSDVQIAVGLARRHRGGLVFAMTAAVALAFGLYFTTRNDSAGVPTSMAPLDRLHIVQLTTSGHALRPAISPDGQYVAYVERQGLSYSLRVRQTGAETNVEVVPPEAGTIIEDVTVTPDNRHLDFVRTRNGQSAVWRVPFLGGTPKLFIENVTSNVGWAPDGRRVAFLRQGVLTLAEADGAREQVLFTHNRSTGVLFSLRSLPPVSSVPAWSPDAKVVALSGYAELNVLRPEVLLVTVPQAAARAVPISGISGGLGWLDNRTLVSSHAAEIGDATQLWRVSYPDGGQSRLTNDLDSYEGVSLSRDRNSLVSTRTESRIGLSVGSADATQMSEVVPPTAVTGVMRTVAWAGDRLLHMSSSSPGRRRSIAVVSAEGGQSEVIISGGYFPIGTSDGKTIVFRSTDQDRSSAGLWRADGDGRNLKMLVSGNVSSPVLTPDDREVIFTWGRSGVQALWTVSLDGGEPVQLANVSIYGFDVSPDGKRLAVSTALDTVMLCDLPRCTNMRTVDGFSDRTSRPLKWMPDGKGIAYIGSDSNIWVQPFDRAPARRLTQFADGPTVTDFAWSHDGKRLAIARATTTTDIVLFTGLNQ